ncbi:unnamed protein product [Nezara viridula]|uniref:Uncharacterized protein n=1 Tax=Nezara viridula TaxID=85310 RepID=A0A9P0HRP2_NEZVI|nr:unnamed protein product [Nezara viridula]
MAELVMDQHYALEIQTEMMELLRLASFDTAMRGRTRSDVRERMEDLSDEDDKEHRVWTPLITISGSKSQERHCNRVQNQINTHGHS